MLETPSLAFAPRRFFEEVQFVSIGGNDLKQFFFAADRENERVRRRYDTLNVSESVAAIKELTDPSDVRTIMAFEEAHKNRHGVVSAAQTRPAAIAKDVIAVD